MMAGIGFRSYTVGVLGALLLCSNVVLLLAEHALLFDIPWSVWLVFNLVGMLPLLFGWHLATKVGQLQQERAVFEDALNSLLHDAQLPVMPTEDVLQKLQFLKFDQQARARREQEIRHLVKVQGLIDHDLAIGNRIFFESKLQHYLQDPQEPQAGAVFLIQLTQLGSLAQPIPFQQRLSDSAEFISQLTVHLPVVVLARVAEQDLALLVPGMNQKDAEQLGDKLATLLSRCYASQAEDDVVHLGFVIYQQQQQSYQVMAEADMALKTAQLQGPNAAFGYEPQQKPKIKGSVWWRTELNQALKQQRFILTFQPVFCWEQQDVVSHEVLVRLLSCEGDELTAAVFLPMAANCGLSQAIDEYVLLKAAQLCQADYASQRRCSINLSVETLLHPQWYPTLVQLLQENQLQARQFAFEVDEYHLLRHYARLKPQLLKIKALGFALIVDHVGLHIEGGLYVDELAIDAIKLHPSMVRDLGQQLEQQLFIRGLVASHRHKGIQVFATGVETEQEWQALRKLGVSGAQGYYFSQPLAQLLPTQGLPHAAVHIPPR